MASSNPYLGLSASLLTTALAAAEASHLKILSSGLANYSVNGKSVAYQQLESLAKTMGQINDALELANGNTATQTFVSFTGL